MKLSVIIPVYKVEKYINQCLQSFRLNNFDSERYEIIIVNDGTPDKSMDIVDEYINILPIKIVNQDNMGLSKARNNGLSIATGDYIWFVDSDDWITPNALITVFKEIQNFPKVEVFASVLLLNNESSNSVYLEYTPNNSVGSGKDYMFRNNNANCGACQRYIIKKDFFLNNKLYFMPGVLHEDGEFALRMLYCSRYLKIISEPIYNYRIRKSGSIMSNIKIKSSYDLVKIHKKLIQFCNEFAYGDKDYWKYRYKIANCLFDSIWFAHKIVLSREFFLFMKNNGLYIRKESAILLLHSYSLTIKQIVTALHFMLFPSEYTQLKELIKKIIRK